MFRNMIAVCLAAGFVVAGITYAQDRPKDTSKSESAGGSRPNYSGQRNWIVIKGSLQDFTGKSDSLLADFDSEAAAREYAQLLNEKEKDWTKWTYTYRMRTQDDSKALSQPDRGQHRTPIEIPNSKFVDVAPLKKDKKSVPSLNTTLSARLGFVAARS